MSDSSMYSSLFELVDSHLSKTSLQETSDLNTTSLCIPRLNCNTPNFVIHSHTRPRLPIPTFGYKRSSIQPILDQQVANMLRAKEKRQEEERQILEEDVKMKLLNLEKEKNSDIDLMKAIKAPYNREVCPNEQGTPRSSSMESLFKLNFADSDSELKRRTTSEPIYPCTTDMSYILKEKVKMGKCSVFGKVLTSRLRPVAAPYLREEIPTNIVKFDFSTPSPCDIAKANLRKPFFELNLKVSKVKFPTVNRYLDQ